MNAEYHEGDMAKRPALMPVIEASWEGQEMLSELFYLHVIEMAKQDERKDQNAA